MGQVSASAFTAYDPTRAAAIQPGPLALYTVGVGSIDPTQVNEGFVEVGKKASAYDLQTPAQIAATVATTIEPVVIGPGGQLYVTDGHHTFTALEDSVYGASNPTVYVNVIANYSNLTTQQFFATMQAQNLLLPLDNGVPQTVNTATGAPIPASLTGLTNDPYRGLEYSILKNKNAKLFGTAANITGAAGTAIPGTDKMTGFYEDFLNAAAYRGANGGLGLPYLSPGDIALASQWALNPASAFTLPNVGGTVTAAQLPGFILAQNLVEGSGALAGTTAISNATLAGGALAANGTFTGITTINAGTAANPITIGTPNTGFVMQLGADKGSSVTLNGTNTYTGGTSILAGTLVAASDAALGATTPSGAAIDPANVKASTQAANGIVFNSLSEGAGSLQLGTTSGNGTAAFALNRNIAVGGETATINLNGYNTTLNGSLVSLGSSPAGLGNATGFSDLTIDDGTSKGVLTLATASPNFYGNVVVGSSGKPTVRVMSDAALGATSANGVPPAEIGQVVLNGGTLQQGAGFTAADRNISLSSGSTIDTAGFTDTWGALSDTQRVLTITNSSTAAAGAATFSSFTVGATATLALTQPTGGAADTVTFTNGIVRSGAATLILQPTAGTLGGTERVMSAGASAATVDGVAPAWIVTNNGTAAGPYDFVSYGANGYTTATYGGTAVSGATAAQAVKLVASQATTGSIAAYALNTNGKTLALGGGTLTLGDGTAADAAGLILAAGSAVSGGTLAFGGSEGVVTTSGTTAVIGAQITGTNGLTFSGAGAVAIGAAANLSGLVTIDSGIVTLGAANVFAGDASGVLLNNTKSTPASAGLSIAANNTVSTLNSAGSNSTVGISNGAVLTIGDGSNQSSTLSSTITETGTGVAGALTKAGTGLLDISAGKLALAAGGTVAVTGGALRTSVGTSASAGYTLSNGADLQFAQNGGGQYSGAVTGAGTLHLIGGTLQLTGTANTYTGGTIVEIGSTLDVTTANLPQLAQNITDAGGLVVFDQSTAGTYGGVISDGRELGTGPTLSGALDIDDSTGRNAAAVTLTGVQSYTGATTVEAGTLTLGVANAVASSSGVTLGRVGGSATAATGVTATLALGANQGVAALNSAAGNATAVALNGFALTVNQAAGTASSFGGTIVDGIASGTLTKSGAGLLTLSGADSFTGGTTLAAGTLELASQGAAGTGAVGFAGAATLQVDGSALSGTIYAGAVTGFALGDALDLRGLAYAADDTATLRGTALTVGDAAGTETLSNFAAAAPYGFKTASDGQGGTLVTLVAGPPQASSTSVTVAPNASTTPIGFAAPTDPSYAASQLAITAGALPTDGTVTLSDGVTAVTAGMSLTAAQLTGLAFTPTAGASNRTSSFTYSVADPAGNTTTGAAALSIGAAPTVPAPAPAPAPAPKPAPTDAIAFDAGVTYGGNGVFMLTGRVSSSAGVSGVEISAQVDGTRQDLGAATVNADGTFTFADPVGASMQNFIYATETDGAGQQAVAGAHMSLSAGIAGEPYVAQQDSYAASGDAYLGSTFFRANGSVQGGTAVAADGSPLSATTVRPDGSSVVNVLASGQTLHAAFFDTFLDHGAPDTTFVFDPGHGFDTVRQFRVGGTDHDTISLLGTDFGNTIADVLRNTTNQAGGAVILDLTSGDTIKLAGISKSQLAQNRSDFAFHA